MPGVTAGREESVAVPSPAARAPRCPPMMSWPGWAAERQARRGTKRHGGWGVVGPNAVRSRQVHALSVLASQLRTPLRMLLGVTVMAVSGQIEITG
jgi:hypothetical protein